MDSLGNVLFSIGNKLVHACSTFESWIFCKRFVVADEVYLSASDRDAVFSLILSWLSCIILGNKGVEKFYRLGVQTIIQRTFNLSSC